MNSGLITLTFTLIGGVIGYFVKDFLDKKREINSENNKIKREIYKKFTSIILDIFNNSKNNTLVKNQDDVKTRLYNFYKDYVLYASPNVINTLSDYMQYIYKNPEGSDTKKMMKGLGKVIGEMRRELGLSNKGLGVSGENVFRALFNDFDDINKK